MDPQIAELYQSMIIEHSKKPRNFGEPETCDSKSEGYNPLCGDHFWLYLDYDANDHVSDIHFKGSGCAISKASMSLMTTLVKGKSKAEIKTMFEKFQSMLRNTASEEDISDLGKLKVFEGVKQFPSRIKCAILGWHAINAAISSKTESVSTE